VSIQLNIVTTPTLPEKFIQDNVIAPFVQLPTQYNTVNSNTKKQ